MPSSWIFKLGKCISSGYKSITWHPENLIAINLLKIICQLCWGYRDCSTQQLF